MTALCDLAGMTIRHASPTAPRDPVLLLGRLVRLRNDWRLSSDDVEALLGAFEASLAYLVREGGQVLAARIAERVRTLHDIASLAGALLAGLDPAEWLRSPCAGLRGRSPLEVLAGDPGGAGYVLGRLRAEYGEARP